MSAVPVADRIEWWPRENVRSNPRNARTHSPEQLADLAGMMRTIWTYPCLVREDPDKPGFGEIIAGHGRYEAAPLAGYHETVKVLVAENWSQALIDRYVLFDNQIALVSGWDDALLVAEMQRMRAVHGDDALDGLGWTDKGLEALLNPGAARQGVKGSLAEAFGVPPFSVLIARDGYWQSRKKAWLALGIRSELGRADKPARRARKATT